MNTFTPGWNDPPQVPRNSQGSSVLTSKSRLLNKRVPFNFSSTSACVPTDNIPKLSHLPEVNQCETGASTTNVSSEDVEAIDISKLTDILKNVTDNVQDSNKRSEIIKRLDLMEKMWKNHEISPLIQQQISDFTNAIELNNIKQADEIYLTLTLNSTSVCSSWIIAFKYILHQCKQ